VRPVQQQLARQEVRIRSQPALPALRFVCRRACEQPSSLDRERRERARRPRNRASGGAAASAIVHARWRSEACSDTRPRTWRPSDLGVEGAQAPRAGGVQRGLAAAPFAPGCGAAAARTRAPLTKRRPGYQAPPLILQCPRRSRKLPAKLRDRSDRQTGKARDGRAPRCRARRDRRLRRGVSWHAARAR